MHRGVGNSRMKDFHDLISLISLEGCLDKDYTDKVVKAVFLHRQTPLEALPIQLDNEAEKVLQATWEKYHEKAFSLKEEKVPNAIRNVVSLINAWLQVNTSLCKRSQVGG